MPINFFKAIKNSKVIVNGACLSLFIFSYCYFTQLYRDTQKIDQLSGAEVGFDILVRHFQAVNFALFNQFPTIGYYADPKVYKINANDLDKEDEATGYFLAIIDKQQPVYNFSRPPLYPLLIGSIYKLFGFKLYYNQILAIFIQSFIICFLPFAGYRIWAKRGFVAGFIAAMWFMFVDCDSVFSHDKIDLIMQLAILTFFSLGATMQAKSNYRYFIFWGILFGLQIHLKPVVLFFPFVLGGLALITYSWADIKQIVPKLFVMFFTASCLILPWSVYKQSKMDETLLQRENWTQALSDSLPELKFSTWSELAQFFHSDSSFIIKQRIYTDLLCDELLAKTLSDNKFLLHQNNELSLDGKAIHSEWQYVTSSFYYTNAYLKSSAKKLFAFYTAHPKYILLLPLKKLSGISLSSPTIFWLAIGLWGLSQILYAIRQSVRLRKQKGIFVLLLFSTAFLWAINSLEFEHLNFGVGLILFLIGIGVLIQQKAPLGKFVYPSLVLSLSLIVVFSFGAERFGDVFLPINFFIIAHSMISIMDFILKKEKVITHS
jgi:hypothetical protein